MPGLDKIIVLKKQSFHRHWLKLWRQTVSTRWDIVIDLRDSIVSRTVPARRRFVFGKHIGRKLHKVEQNAAVMKLAVPPDPVLFISPVQEGAARRLIPDGDPVLALGPAANWIGKTWPAQRFIELAARLTAPDGIMPGARVAIFAAPGEEGIATRVLESVPEDRRIDMIAKTDPGTAAAALQRCDLYIGNDSGLMHCAAAAGIPTLGLFGPSWPHLYRPWGVHTAWAGTPETFAELTDFPGYDSKTLDRTLMETLDIETVMRAVYALIRK